MAWYKVTRRDPQKLVIVGDGKVNNKITASATTTEGKASYSIGTSGISYYSAGTGYVGAVQRYLYIYFNQDISRFTKADITWYYYTTDFRNDQSAGCAFLPLTEYIQSGVASRWG